MSFKTLYYLDATLASSTMVLCTIIVLAMASWAWRLRKSRSRLKPLFISTALFKAVLAFWAAGNLWVLLSVQFAQPVETLAPRLLIFAAAVIQVWVVYVMARPELVDKRDAVLVVEDDRAYQRYIVQVLRSRGYQTVCAATGTEAIDLLSSSQYLVALVDMLLPDLNGLEVARRSQGTPLVAMSGGLEMFDRQVLGAAGFSAFLDKPSRREEVLAVVQAMLPRRDFPSDPGQPRLQALEVQPVPEVREMNVGLIVSLLVQILSHAPQMLSQVEQIWSEIQQNAGQVQQEHHDQMNAAIHQARQARPAPQA